GLVAELLLKVEQPAPVPDVMQGEGVPEPMKAPGALNPDFLTDHVVIPNHIPVIRLGSLPRGEHEVKVMLFQKLPEDFSALRGEGNDSWPAPLPCHGDKQVVKIKVTPSETQGLAVNPHPRVHQQHQNGLHSLLAEGLRLEPQEGFQTCRGHRLNDWRLSLEFLDLDFLREVFVLVEPGKKGVQGRDVGV